MRNINFAQIKKAVSPKDVALHYDLKVGRSDMICCPFHGDKTPSMKLYDDNFFCFGCNKSWDVIDFTAELFGLSKLDAAKKLACDFGINCSEDSPVKVQIPYTHTEQFKRDQNEVYLALVNYLKYLEFKCSEPDKLDKSKGDFDLPVYISMREYISYLCDIFVSGEDDERAETIEALKPHLEALRSYTFGKEAFKVDWL